MVVVQRSFTVYSKNPIWDHKKVAVIVKWLLIRGGSSPRFDCTYNFFILDLWGCPPGYLMLEMNCYKMFRIAKMFSESEIACQLEGGIVAKPITLLQVRAIQITRDIHGG